MKKKLPLLLTIFLSWSIVTFAQCPPGGLLLFDSQSDIDNFIIQYPSCTQISNNIEITGNDITNLNGFSNLTAIGGYVDFYLTPSLTNLTGFNNLASTGAFYLYYQTSLSDISALSNLTTVNGDLVILEDDALTSLTGLNNVASVAGYLQVDQNNLLANLSGLSGLTTVGAQWTLEGNNSLTSVNGLENLNSIGGYIYIVGNPALASLSALSSLTAMNGYLDIDNNDSLTSLSGIDNINPANISHLYLTSSNNLSVCNVASVCQYLSNAGAATITGNATGCGTIPQVNAVCATSCFVSTTWNGSAWNNGNPDASKTAIFTGNYNSTGNLTACSLSISNNAQVTVNAGDDFNIKGPVTITPGASLTFESNANLVQDFNMPNIGNIVYKRNATMRRLDYTYWSAPVSLQNLKAFSPQTVSPPVGSSRFYELDETANSFSAVNPLLNDFLPAKGYSIRAPNNFPATPQNFPGVFTGIPNNGNINIPVTVTGGLGYNLIGNPYPSPISADLFLADNPGTLYFWTHTDQSAISGANYASYTNVGMVSVAGGQIPNGSIQSGQGFILQKATAGNAVFKNSMRVGNNDGQFFRTNNNPVEKHRLWLNLSSDSINFNQILIGYLNDATQAEDISIDGKLLETGTAISSIIGDQRYSIQGRGLPFSDTDAVMLNFKAATAGSYSIAIDHADGVFAADQGIFLKDNLTGIVQDLKQNPYAFASEAGNFANRFEIVYQNTTLGTGENIISPEKTVIYKENNTIIINAGNARLDTVKVFDIRGRLIYESGKINNPVFNTGNLQAEQQVLLVQVTAQGKSFTKKIIY